MALTITIPGAVETTTGSTAPAVLTVGVGAPGQGVPSGGTSGQVLQKLSGVSYDTGWLTLPADFITSVTSPLAVASGVLSVDLSAYSTTAQAAALYYPLAGNPSAFLVAADITGKANLASPSFTGNVSISSSTGAALFIEQTGTGNILTLHDQASDTTFVTIDANGKVSTIASEATNGAGFNIAHGVAPTTPVNGDIWTTTSGLFMRQNGATKQYVDLDTSQTINGNKTFSNATQTLGNSTATGTISVASGATISASTKTVNVATGGVVGSTTNITVGPVLGASTTSIGNTTAASTLNLATGATLTATTKAVNIGTAGVAGSTTNIAIGSTTGTSTTTLQGITNGITQTAADSSLKLATTAFVTTADNLKANLASPTFTGTPTLPTGTIATTQSPGDNTTALATTAFVTAAVPAFATNSDTNSPSSTTKVMSPSNVLDLILSANFQLLYLGAGVSGTSGTGSYFGNNGGRWHDLQTANASTSGYGAWCFDTNTSGNGFVASNRGANYRSKNWSKKIWLSGRAMIGHGTVTTVDGDANTFFRCGLGGKSSFSTGDISSSIRGITIKVPGGGSAAMVLQVSNGSTVTSVTSSFTPTLRQVFDWKLYSDGAGNVTLYVNDSQVATTTAGPTGSQDYGLYWEACDSNGSNTVPFATATFGAKIYYAV